MRASSLILLLLLASCIHLKGQDDQSALSLSSGLNFSRPEVEGNRLQALARPYFGLIYQKDFQPPFSMLFSFNVFSKASLYSPALRLEQKGIELGFGAQWNIDDLGIQGGVLLSNPIQEDFQIRSNSATGVVEPEIGEYSALQAYFGVQFKLIDNVDLLVNQSFAIDDMPYGNFQIGVRIHLWDGKAKHSYRQLKEQAAKRQIRELHKGVLLVRMRNPQLSIAALEQAGMQAKAIVLRQEVEDENQLIAQTFETHYDFSKVYFFYSQHSSDIRKGNFNGILLNHQLVADSSIDISKEQAIYTAEFGQVGEDTLAFYEYTSYEGGGAFQNKAQAHFYGTQHIGFDALVISDRDFNQLSRPFPYYSRWMYPAFETHPEIMLVFPPLSIPFILTHSRIEKVVERLNRRLHNYYLKQASSD